MGTVLSFSPQEKKGAMVADQAERINKNEASIKQHPVIVSALTLKKLVAASAKRSVKKVNPNPPTPSTSNEVEQLNNENNKGSQQPEPEIQVTALPLTELTVPTQSLQPNQAQVPGQNGKLLSVKKQPSRQSMVSPRHVIIQASTGELLNCLGDFLCRRCNKLKELSSGEVILWFRNVDRSLLIQGWQDYGFITPANLVFVYLLCKDMVTEDIDSPSELQGLFLSCLYLAYTYIGSEISYPHTPFMVEANKDVFWDRSLTIIDQMSAKMLQFNSDPHFFTEVFQQLKDEGEMDSNVDR